MTPSGRSRGSLAFIAAAAVATAVFPVWTPGSVAQEDVAEGKGIWTERAGCPQCHGWAGDGLASGFHSPGGLPLRKTCSPEIRFA